jgi:hypothetical protein
MSEKRESDMREISQPAKDLSIYRLERAKEAVEEYLKSEKVI